MVEKAWKRKQRANKLAFAVGEIEKAGLVPARKEAPLFRALGVAEARQDHRKVIVWWAPAELVRLNNYMVRVGLSHKLRNKVLRDYLANKEPSGALAEVMAGYTEELLLRQG